VTDYQFFFSNAVRDRTAGYFIRVPVFWAILEGLILA
jgi:hypothetical protein